jgi:hypothetical protein
MPITGDPTTTALSLTIQVRDGKTMTQHRMGEKSVLTFKNEADDPLVITCMSHAEPFLEEGCSNAVATFTVAGKSTKSVRIASNFNAASFTYSARIGNSEPEDPIVIVDRR